MNGISVKIRRKTKKRFSSFIRICSIFFLLFFLTEKNCDGSNEIDFGKKDSFFPFKISLGFTVCIKNSSSKDGFQKNYFEAGLFLRLKDGSLENIAPKYYNYRLFISEDSGSLGIFEPGLDQLKKEDLNAFIKSEYENYSKLVGSIL